MVLEGGWGWRARLSRGGPYFLATVAFRGPIGFWADQRNFRFLYGESRAGQS